MKKRRITVLAVIFLCAVLTGCGERAKTKNNIEDLTEEGVITWETSKKGIPAKSKDFKEKLVSGSYYVVHDDVYYPLYHYGSNFDDAPNDYVEPGRQVYFTTANEINIPTLFEGDELVYYSTEGLLDYMIWERYYDMGYTIGLLNLQTMESGRVYLDLSDEEEVNIVPDSELYAMYSLNAEKILIDKIGGMNVDSSLINDGIISYTKKSKIYDLEVYTGTYFQHYQAVANTHALKAYELYASIEYEPLQEFLYRIEVPDYFVTGYYFLDGCGIVRIVRGDSYSEETDYNVQVLFPEVSENGDPDAYIAPRRYSSYEPLNKFQTNVKGCLGYVSSDQENIQESGELSEVILREATTNTVDLFFPKDKACLVQIKSLTGETTGDIYITIGNSIKLVNYDRLEGIYEAQLSGKGEKGTLTVTGLTDSYDIILTNCEQYTNQLELPEKEPERQR